MDFECSGTEPFTGASASLNLSAKEQCYLLNNGLQKAMLDHYLDQGGYEKFAEAAVEAWLLDGEVDIENRLIYNPAVSQDYRSRMSPAEVGIFDTLSVFQKEGYLRAATQAYIYAETHFTNPVRNRLGDAFKHTFWNALSTDYIGEVLTEQLTTANEDIPYNYPNHFKETEMDLYNNAQGRQIAYGAGRLYQLVQSALNNRDIRYLNYLEFSGVFWRATNNSQLTPTNQ